MSQVSKPVRKKSFLYGIGDICKKEILHMRRESSTYYFPFVFAAMQTLMIGFGVNTNVRQINTVVYDLAHTQESRALVQQFINTDGFRIVDMVYSDEELYESIVAGKARVGIKIPSDYSRRLMEGNPANVRVSVDGATLQITATASTTANALMVQESIRQATENGGGSGGSGGGGSTIEARRNILFNPDNNTANFTMPGIMAILMQGIIIGQVYMTIVRERETGTLEQLYLTPAKPLAVILGKIAPYAILGFTMQIYITIIVCSLLDVAFRGSFILLQILTVPFILTCLGLGMVISVKSKTGKQGGQWLQILFISSVMLSGYTYDVDSMPYPLQLVSKILPVSHYLEITRGIMVRGAELRHLWMQGLWLLVLGVFLIIYSAVEFQRKARKAGG